MRAELTAAASPELEYSLYYEEIYFLCNAILLYISFTLQPVCTKQYICTKILQ